MEEDRSIIFEHIYLNILYGALELLSEPATDKPPVHTTDHLLYC